MKKKITFCLILGWAGLFFAEKGLGQCYPPIDLVNSPWLSSPYTTLTPSWTDTSATPNFSDHYNFRFRQASPPTAWNFFTVNGQNDGEPCYCFPCLCFCDPYPPAQSIFLNALKPCTVYDMQVQKYCAATGATSAWSPIEQMATSCLDAYFTANCHPEALSHLFCAISSVNIGDQQTIALNPNCVDCAGCDGVPTGFELFPATLDLNIAPTMPLTVILESGTSSVTTGNVRAWIDFNKDFDFFDAGELIFNESVDLVSDLVAANNITFPANLNLGLYRMRLVFNATGGANPCSVFDKGHVIDFKLNITACPNPPVASITGPTAVCSGAANNFSASATGGTAPHTYKWSTAQTTQNISQSFAAPATLTVTVTDATGCTGTAAQAISINAAPVATFSASVNGLTANFINNSTSATSYLWNFGDGQTSMANSPSHVFSAGTFNVCLTAMGCGSGQEVCQGVVIGGGGGAGAPCIEREKSLGGTKADVAHDMQQTADGGYILAGFSTFPNSGDVNGNHGGQDLWVIKLDADFDTIWTKNLGTAAFENAYSIQQTADGGYIVAGSARNNPAGNGKYDFWVVKLTSVGATVWSNFFGGAEDEIAKSVQQTTDGGYIVAGSTKTANNAIDDDVWGNHGQQDFWVVRLNQSGDTLWTRCLGGAGNDYAECIIQTTAGGYVVAGSFTDALLGSEVFVAKLNASGVAVWQETFGGSLTDSGNSIIEQADGTFWVAALSNSINGDVVGNNNGGTAVHDYWVFKVDAAGNFISGKCFGGTKDDIPTDIQKTSDGGFVVAGRSASSEIWGNHGGGSFIYDFWVVKFNSAGDTLWTRSMGGSKSEYAYAVEETADGGFVVAGSSSSEDGDVSFNHKDGVNTTDDFWIVKLNTCSLLCDPKADSTALVALFDATNPPGWVDSTNWKTPGQPIKNWFGISTNAAGCVDSIMLKNNNLTGQLPTAIGDFNKLQLLSLSGNSLFGQIPATVANLQNLKNLDLSANDFADSLPPMAGMAALDSFFIDKNQLTFEDFLPQIGFLGGLKKFKYSAQDSVFAETVFQKNAGDALTIDLGFDAAISSNIYQWTKNGSPWAAPPPNVQNLNQLIFNALKATDAGVYYVKVTNQTASGLVLFSRKITINVACPAATATISGILGFCPGGSTMLTASAGESYIWSNSQTAAQTTINVPGAISVTVTDANGCTAVGSATVVAHPAAVATILGNLEFCTGQSTTLTASGGSCSWSNGQTASQITVNQPGQVSVTVTDANSCTASDSKIITENPLATVAFAAKANGLTVSFANNSTNASGYFWDFGDGQMSNAVEPNHDFAAPGDYTVCLTITADCNNGAETCQTVTVANIVPPTCDPAADRQHLTEFFNQTGGANWALDTNWNTAAPLNLWYGIETDAGGCVNCIDLDGDPFECAGWVDTASGNGLVGMVPAVIGSFPMLGRLSLAGNFGLTGTLPDTFGGLDQLFYLNARRAKISGPLPPSFLKLPNLLDVDLSHNLINGPLVAEWGDLPKLQSVVISNAGLTGPIPADIGEMDSLVQVVLDHNNLTGALPAAWSAAGRLQALLLHNNRLDDLPDLSALSFFEHIIDDAHEFLVQNNRLTFADLWPNREIILNRAPSFYAPQDSILQETIIQVPIGTDFVFPVNVDENVPNCQFEWSKGAAPLGPSGNDLVINNFQSLNEGDYFLKIKNTDLPLLTLHGRRVRLVAGTALPCSATKDSLALVALFDDAGGLGWTTKINWKIAGQPLKNWHGIIADANQCVTEINLGYNKLAGLIPPEIGDMMALKKFTVSGNKLTGSIPPAMGKLKKLEWLKLDSNLLEGPIPPALGDLSELTILHGFRNKLTGNIPPALGKLQKLLYLELGNNLLDGPIPPELGNMTAVIDIRFEKNKLSGPIPDSLGKLQNLTTLILSSNQLTGAIPSDIGELKKLRFLFLEDNLIDSLIPQKFEELTALEEFYIQQNRLTFEDIRPRIAFIKALLYYDYAPQDSVFHDTTITRFIGTALDFSLDFDEDVPGNVFDWKKGGVPQFQTLYNNNFKIDTLENTDAGIWTVEVTNPAAPALKLFSHKITLNLVPCPAVAALISKLPNISEITCKDSTISLSGIGGTTFSWSGPGGLLSIKNPITAALSGTYTVTVKDTNGCTGTAQVVLTENTALPIATISNVPNTTVLTCKDSTVVLTAGGGTSYFWSGPGIASPVQNPATATVSGIYNVTVTGANGCTATAQTALTENKTPPVPTISALPNTTVLPCNPKMIELTAGGGTTFSWSGPGGLLSIQNPITAALSGTYTVTVKDTNGCTATKSTILTDAPAPAVSIAQQQPAQIPGTAVVVISGGTPLFTYNWDGTAMGQGGPVAAGSHTIPNLLAGPYSLKLTDANGCTAVQNFTISDCPVGLMLVPTDDFCANGNGAIDLTVTATGPVTYKWSNGATTKNLAGIPADSYSVTVTLTGNGCTATASATVLEVLPTISISSKVETCQPGDQFYVVKFQVLGGTAPYFSNGQNIPGGLFESGPIASGQPYSLEILDKNGCKTTVSGQKSCDCAAPPVPEIAVSPGPFCEKAAIQLTEKNPKSVQWNWSGPNGFSDTLENPVAVLVLGANQFFVTITDDLGCTGTGETTINAVAVPPVEAVAMAFFCENEPIKLMETGGATGVKWAWKGPNNFTSNLQNPTIAAPTAASAGLYIVVVTSTAGGCTAADSVAVALRPAIETKLETTICRGDSIEVCDKKFWVAGNFTAICQSAAGCDSTVSLKLTVRDGELAMAFADVAILAPDATELRIEVTENDTLPATGGWEISIIGQPAHSTADTVGGGFVKISIAKTPGFSDWDRFTYLLCPAICPNSCDSAVVAFFVQPDSFQVVRDLLPNILTPGTDGQSDFFDPVKFLEEKHGYKIDRSKSAMTIVNRWGETVFSVDPYPQEWDGWDGKNSIWGGAVPTATYYYLLRLRWDGKSVTVKGPIQVLRSE